MTLIKIETKAKADLDSVWEKWTGEEHIINWYFASDDWACPKAENELNGKFNYRMESKDGSIGFDFSGKHLTIIPRQSIQSVLDDGRKMKVSFSEEKDHVLVLQEFEAESQNSEDLQRQGWQAILNNFAKYAEK